MEFFRKGEQAKLHKGDVIRFKNNDEHEYHYAIISELPEGAFDGGERQHYAAIILNDCGGYLCKGYLYRVGTTIEDLIKTGLYGWDSVEKAKTRTEDLTD